MGEIIASIFGKDRDDFTEQDIKDKITSCGYQENHIFDAKTIKEPLTVANKENPLIKPLVSFLNTIEGKGVLCLGVTTNGHRDNICSGILPVDKTILKNIEGLRNQIIPYLGSFPNTLHKPHLDIRIIETERGNLFLVEVTRRDNNCIYYSKCSDYIYVRNNDESNKLNLQDSLTFIHQKLVPGLEIYFDQAEVISNNIVYNLAFLNNGLEPARDTLALINFNFDLKGIKPKIEGLNVQDLSHLNKGMDRSFQIRVKNPIYPKSPSSGYKFNIPNEPNFRISVDITIYEKNGHTEQIIIITRKDNGVIEQRLIKKTFNPYINFGI